MKSVSRCQTNKKENISKCHPLSRLFVQHFVQQGRRMCAILPEPIDIGRAQPLGHVVIQLQRILNDHRFHVRQQVVDRVGRREIQPVIVPLQGLHLHRNFAIQRVEVFLLRRPAQEGAHYARFEAELRPVEGEEIDQVVLDFVLRYAGNSQFVEGFLLEIRLPV